MADTYQESRVTSSSIFLDVEYVKSLDSVCKIIEMVFGLSTFISACVWGTWRGGGWVQFVGIFSFIVIGIFFIMKLLRIVQKLPNAVPVVLIELITCAVFTLFYFIAGVVAGVSGWILPAITAASVFSFFNMIAFGADTFLQFQNWRSGGGAVAFGSSNTTSTSTTTTTVTMTTEADPKY